MSKAAANYQKIIAQCWADETFKRKLLADPAGTLKSQGIDVPNGRQVSVVENTAQKWTLVIPAKPTEISDEQLDSFAAGSNQFPPGMCSSAMCCCTE